VGQLHAPAVLPPEIEPSVPTVDATWALEPVWTRQRREKSLVPAGNRTPAVQPIARRYIDSAIPAHARAEENHEKPQSG
jgi:hypothetical protein